MEHDSSICRPRISANARNLAVSSLQPNQSLDHEPYAAILRGNRGQIIDLVETIIRTTGPDNITFRKIAEKLCVSTRTLSRYIKTEGETYRRIYKKIQTEMAQEMLKSDQLSIYQIAQNLGYSDASNFTKSFKKRIGVVPSQYRSYHRATENRALIK